jgi:nucleotide-binding universal stress UspA family protein
MALSDGRRPHIVVGVDGSDNSTDALRWAAHQAELTGATMDAVIAWTFPAFHGWAPAETQDLDFASFAEQALAGAVDDVFGPDRPAWLRTRVVVGHAAQVLVEASADADLLVVGSRGYGGFAGALRARSAATAFIMRAALSRSSGRPTRCQWQYSRRRCQFGLRDLAASTRLQPDPWVKNRYPACRHGRRGVSVARRPGQKRAATSGTATSAIMIMNPSCNARRRSDVRPGLREPPGASLEVSPKKESG